jgi:hypothetical protein
MCFFIECTVVVLFPAEIHFTCMVQAFGTQYAWLAGAMWGGAIVNCIYHITKNAGSGNMFKFDPNKYLKYYHLFCWCVIYLIMLFASNLLLFVFNPRITPLPMAIAPLIISKSLLIIYRLNNAVNYSYFFFPIVSLLDEYGQVMSDGTEGIETKNKLFFANLIFIFSHHTIGWCWTQIDRQSGEILRATHYFLYWITCAYVIFTSAYIFYLVCLLT